MATGRRYQQSRRLHSTLSGLQGPDVQWPLCSGCGQWPAAAVLTLPAKSSLTARRRVLA